VHVASGSHAKSDPINGSTNPRPSLLYDGTVDAILHNKKDKGSPYSITERRVPELIPVLGSQPAGDVSHKPGGRLPLFFARPAVTPQPLRGLLPILLHDGCEQFA